MEKLVNYHLEILTNINISCHILPYLSYISDSAQIFLRLWSKTNKFWNKYKEIISCSILKNNRYRICLEFSTDFEMKHAKMLLDYRTYLLYNIDVNLKSADSFKAINYFLKRVKGKISSNFFNEVNATISLKWLDYYNEFIRRFMNMGFNAEKINTTVCSDLSNYKKSRSK